MREFAKRSGKPSKVFGFSVADKLDSELVRGKRQDVVGIMFADAVGFSKLREVHRISREQLLPDLPEQYDGQYDGQHAEHSPPDHHVGQASMREQTMLAAPDTLDAVQAAELAGDRFSGRLNASSKLFVADFASTNRLELV